MAIALVTGNITYNSGASTVSTSGAITISPSMSAGQYLVIVIGGTRAAWISAGTNLQLIGSFSTSGANDTLVEFVLMRATGTASSYTVTQSTTAGLAAVAAVFSATNKLRFDTSNFAIQTTATSLASAAAATTASASELWIGAACARAATGGITFSAAQIGGTNADNTYQTSPTAGSTNDRATALWYRLVSGTGGPTATITASATLSNSSTQVVCIEETAAGGGGLRLAGPGGLAS